jgi:hypothetical protein
MSGDGASSFTQQALIEGRSRLEVETDMLALQKHMQKMAPSADTASKQQPSRQIGDSKLQAPQKDASASTQRYKRVF